MALLRTSEEDAERISNVIFKYGGRIAREQDPENLLHLNADMARDLIAAERCSIWLVDRNHDQLWTKVAHGVGQLRIPLGQGLVGACVREDAPIVVNDAAADPRFLSRVDSGSGYLTRSVLVVPMHGGEGEVIGAAQALNKPDGFTNSDINLLSLVASYAATVIEAQKLRQTAEEARLVLHEIEIAREVQQELLPQLLPEIAGLDCAAFCRPANFVGGDYYDFLKLNDGRLAFTLGDVSGKGIAAAVLMASIQSALRAQMRIVSSPAELLNEFNESVVASSTPERYSTLFCGRIDPDLKSITCVNAGHVQPMLLRQNGDSPRIERLTAGGFPIGLIEGARYNEESVEIGPGDVLLCYSDGLSEAMNPEGNTWDDQPIENILMQSGGLSAEEIIGRVVSECDNFVNGAHQSDDMTLTVIRVL